MKKLMRSNNDKVISGVCGGLGEYFSIDPTIIRIACFILAIPSLGTLLLAYIVCSIVIPSDNNVIYQDNNESKLKDNTPFFLGLGLILIGAYYLARIFFPFLNHLIYKLIKFWPILLIVLGIYIISNQNNKR